MNAQDTLLQYFSDGTLSGCTFAEICRFLRIPHREKNGLYDLLDALCEEGKLFCARGGRYGTPEQLGFVRGRISGSERGFAFLVPDDREKYPDDLFIPRKFLHGALHGDLVWAERTFGREGDEAEVVRILERGYQEIVGTFYKNRQAGWLVPDERKFSKEIFIPLSDCYNIPDGVKAVAKITDYPRGKSPGGYISEILGEEGDFFAEELSLIRSFGLREEFPDGLEREAERAAKRSISAEIKRRKDLRDLLIATIDGEDTRDIDDAVSLERTEKGWLLGVHIADVSHYVPYLSPLDKEAYARGTSVYFPDRVLPMLPRALSNGACSLNEGEDRLTLSCLMTLDEKGKVRDAEIAESVIRSRRRMTYTEVQAILDGDEKTAAKFADVKDMVCLFGDLARLLKARRKKRGSIDLDVKETKIMLDKDGEIVIPDTQVAHSFSHEIIEQFMVLANETVAETMQAQELPFVFRIHEKPDEEKAAEFLAFARHLGVRTRIDAADVKPYNYANLLSAAEGMPAYAVLNRAMLRSMQKARYSPVNAGHFGLASDCYCHFTSPIRRYPDLCIHRIIKESLHGEGERAERTYREFVSPAAKQSSDCERRAAEAEREVDALYETMYMSERVGKTYPAVLSGVADFGLFAELSNGIEGFIPIESLPGMYDFIPERLTLKGNGESWSLGDEVEIEVDSVDFARRRTRFRLLGKRQKENAGEKEKS